jgi:sugar lactone lactonase YvrE
VIDVLTRSPGPRLVLVLLALAAACGYDSGTGVYNPAPDLNEGLWTSAGVAPAILRLAPAQLLTSGRATAATQVTTGSADLFTLNSIAFDDDGKMWITSEADSRLLGFAAGDLHVSGERAAGVVVTAANNSLQAPSGLAFDGQRRLWVANFVGGTLVRFDAAQLAASGAPVPSVVIGGLGHPTSLAFDAAGALWVSDAQASTLVKYSPAQLAASGSPAPVVVLSAANGSLADPLGIAFDAAGNLWVTNNGDETIAAFTAAQLAASGSPEPQIRLTTNHGTARIPVGLAFDKDGSLWVVTADGGLEKFTTTQLAASGRPEPTVALQVSEHNVFWSVAFWPKPAGLPLN